MGSPMSLAQLPRIPFFGCAARVLSQAGTAYVTYENCIVPKKYLIGTENKGRIDHSHEDFK